MTARDSNLRNAFQTQLTAAMGATDTTATVGSTTGMTSPGYLVIDPRSATKREYIYFDGTFTSTTFVTSTTANRYLTGSAQASGITHDIGAEVWCVPTQQHFEDLHDRIDAHEADTVDAHDASAISSVPAGNLVATTVQAALNELDTEKQPLDTDLTAIAALTSAANKVPYATGAGTWGLLDFKDEDDMTSDSATAVPSQQSVKAYVDANSGTSGATVVRKSADESVTSSTTLQDDDELEFAIGANETWAAMFVVFVGSGDENADIKLDITVPAGATQTIGIHGLANTTTSYIGDLTAIMDTSVVAGIDNAEKTVLVVYACVANGATPGSVTLRWAQFVSSGSATTVKAGSHLVANKVA